MHQQQIAFENSVGKGRFDCNEQFFLFPQCFLLNQIIVSPFVHVFEILSLFAAEFEEPKIGLSGRGLIRTLNAPWIVSNYGQGVHSSSPGSPEIYSGDLLKSLLLIPVL